MFVQHKQLKYLNVQATKVARLNTSSSTVQVALQDYPPQLAEAYLVALSGGDKVMVLVGFYLTENKASIFFVPKQGEVAVEEIEQVFDDGFVFAESMGFILSDADFHLLTSDDQQKLWNSLPICRNPELEATVEKKCSATESAVATGTDLETYRQRSLESLGRFLSSL